jgi:predicted SAM-dependent methyltransferase
MTALPQALRARLRRLDDPALRHVLLRGRAGMSWLGRGHVVRRSAVRRYLASTSEPKFHFGAGPFDLEGWLNTDLIGGNVHIDVGRRLPLPDATFAYAFGEHVIEHLSERAAIRLLGELHRVLRPGGVVRLTTPDLAKLVALYEDRNPLISREEYARTWLDAASGGRVHENGSQVLNDALRLWGHRWIYDEEDLAGRLERAGFGDVRRQETGVSEHTALRGLESHGDLANRVAAMTLEATRP